MSGRQQLKKDKPKPVDDKTTTKPAQSKAAKGKTDKADKIDKTASSTATTATSILNLTNDIHTSIREPPPLLDHAHRDLTNCPCGTSRIGQYYIDCSRCKQTWHAHCLSLGGITEDTIKNIKTTYLCPFCYVAPVPTCDTSHTEGVCYICRNTLALQQSNLQLEAAMKSSKLASLVKIGKLLDSIDFDHLHKNLDTLATFDSHIMHLLLKEDALGSLDKKLKTLSDQLSSHTYSPTLQSLPSLITSYDESLEQLVQSVQSLEKQVTEIKSAPQTSTQHSSDHTDSLLERISQELKDITHKEESTATELSSLKESISHLKTQPPTSPTHHPTDKSPAHAPTQTISPPPSVMKPFVKYIPNFIDTSTERELTELLDSLSDKFHQENGRATLAFGQRYGYSGAKSVDNTITEIPAPLVSLASRLNPAGTSSAGTSPITSVLVNRYTGTESFLPQHSDNEQTIHPESQIHTLSLGQSSTIIFSRHGETSAYETLECHSKSLYSMSRCSQDLFEHRIDSSSEHTGTRYSITLREVSPLNRASTCIIGDSNTCDLKFGEERGKSFGKFLPGRQIFAPTIDKIDPYACCGFNNVVVLCGLNDIRKDEIKSAVDVKRIFNTYVEKVLQIQAVNVRANLFICPLLPTKCIELNRKVNFFNYLIDQQLLPTNFGVRLIHGFADAFADENGLLIQDLSRKLTRFRKPDYLHLNWKGVAKLANMIKDTVLVKVNGGRRRRRVDDTPYSEISRQQADRRNPVGDGYQSE